MNVVGSKEEHKSNLFYPIGQDIWLSSLFIELDNRSSEAIVRVYTKLSPTKFGLEKLTSTELN